jgi:hypothetical protein
LRNFPVILFALNETDRHPVENAPVGVEEAA